MKKLFLLLTLSVFSIGAFAQTQNFAWAKRIGSTGDDRSYAITTDASGNIYMTGLFQGTVDFNPGAGVFNMTSASVTDNAFVSKYDSSGNFIWAKSFAGTSQTIGLSIVIDGIGNVYTTGSLSGSADFDPGAGTYNLGSGGGNGIYISKLDASGNFVWAKVVDGVNGASREIKLDGNGNVLITGSFPNTVDFNPDAGTFNLTASGNSDIFILKLDNVGAFVWAKQMGGNLGDASWALAIDGFNNIYTTGSFTGTADFDPSAVIYNLVDINGGSAFISKLDAAGNFVWAKQISGTSNLVIGQSLAIDYTGNVLTKGGFSGTVDFDPGVGVYNLASAGSLDIFILKLDESGNFIWAKNLDGAGSTDVGNCLALDDFGGVYTTGWYIGTADFDPGVGIYNLISTAGNYDIFISKLDAGGNFVWAKSMGGSSEDYGYSITLDPSGNVYSTGYFGATADFDPSAGVYNMISAGSYDIYVHKLFSHCDPPVIATNGSTIICGNNSIDISSTTIGTSYQWYKNDVLIGGASSQVYSATLTGSYKCVVAILCGIDTSNSIQITKYSLPTITLTTSGPTTFCNGDSVIISASSNAGGFATWQWYKDNVVISGATNNSYKATTAGTYKCTVTNSSTTCSRISTGVVVSILITNANVTAGSSTTFCFGGNVLLTAVTNAGAGSTYQWYLNSTIIGGATNTAYTASASGNYTFSVNNSNGCSATSLATSVTVNPLPVVTITPSGSTIICPSGTVSLTSSTGASYLWSTAATTQTIIVSTAGNYSVTVTNVNGCSAASAPISVSLSACETPTNITATNITGSSATINWTGNNCAAKYRVHVRALGTTTWSTLVVTAPTTTKNITGLQSLTTYEYQVRTDCNTAGTSYSAYSSIQTFTTLCSCTKPTNIAVSNVTQTGATVSWVGNACAVKYRLQYRIQGTTTWTTKSITAPIVTKTLTLLTSNTIYEYRLRSDCNSTGSVNSGWTTTATITTPLRLEDSEISFSTFYVSPNPCSTCFVNGTMDEQDLIVSDIVGRKVNVQFTKSEYGFYINMPDARKGLYLIRNNKTGEVVKFVRE